MGYFNEAQAIANELLTEGKAVEEIVSALNQSPEFEQYIFYYDDDFVYMEHEDGTSPTMKVCHLPKEAEE